MRMTLAVAIAGTFLSAAALAKPLRVYISVDMEGVTGVVSGDQVGASGKDYDRFRKQMTAEANAAIEGAVAAGATQVLVNDSHGSMTNLLGEELRAPAELISSNIKPLGMMQGIDQNFDAVIFIGYHAKAGSPVGVLAHTGSGSVRDLRINGKSVGEGGMNIYAAGAVGVPVVLISGDQIAIEQARELVPNIEAVQVKEAIGTRAARSLRPEESVRLIREGTQRALRRLSEFKPVAPSAPIRIEASFNDPAIAMMAEQVPTVARIGPNDVAFPANDYLSGYRLFRVLYKFLVFPH